MVAAHRPVTEVSYQLGHSPVVSLGTYQHLIDEAYGKPVKPVEGWIREARAEGGEEAATG